MRDVAPNHIVVIGNLVADPQLEAFPSGQPVLNFHLAEQTPKETNFHKVILVGVKAEKFAQTYKKGDSICVTGRLMSTTRPCRCCQDPKHQLVTWEVWAFSAGASGVF